MAISEQTDRHLQQVTGDQAAREGFLEEAEFVVSQGGGGPSAGCWAEGVWIPRT